MTAEILTSSKEPKWQQMLPTNLLTFRTQGASVGATEFVPLSQHGAQQLPLLQVQCTLEGGENWEGHVKGEQEK